MFLNTHSVWEKRKLRTVKPDQNKEYKKCQKEIKEVQDKINILEAKRSESARHFDNCKEKSREILDWLINKGIIM
jgi:peptidoglycan hydrolase CwlO-like protein